MPHSEPPQGQDDTAGNLHSPNRQFIKTLRDRKTDTVGRERAGCQTGSQTDS